VPLPFHLRTIRIRNFRCLEHTELELHPDATVISGGNGAGKTSVLEAIHLLGRGQSFRTADPRTLIRSGAAIAEVGGTFRENAGDRAVTVHIAANGLSLELDGGSSARATLARALPLLIMDAGVQELVQGSPEQRRRLLDWGLFHVEHRYLDIWREYRRALQQRNASLRLGSDPAELETWDEALSKAGTAVHELRHAYVLRLLPVFSELVRQLLETPSHITYSRGWPEDRDLREALRASRAADVAQGQTRHGPHRGDVVVELDEERARGRSSRGQQKLLGAALVLGQTRLVAAAREDRVLLLVDEPEVDLDALHAARLITVLRRSPAQLVVAAITGGELLREGGGAMFHVEHGAVKALL
jgi:DNA replication and repair protein RecF